MTTVIAYGTESTVNKIVKRHYPVARLPSDIQAHLSGVDLVELQITPEQAHEGGIQLAPLVGTFRNVHGDEAAVIAHIRSLREED